MQKQISTIISLKDRFSQPLLRMSDNVKSLDRETRSSMNRVNRWGKQVERSVDRALKSTAKWAKRGAVALGGYSIKKGVDATVEMDEYVRKVQAIAGDELSQMEIEGRIADLTLKWGVDRTDIGETLYQAISSGVDIDIDTLSNITGLSHKLSLTGYTEMQEAVSLLASTGNVFGMKEYEDYQRFANQLLRTQQLGKVEVGEMAHHYGTISSLTQAMDIPFEQQTAAIATMTRLGMTASDATTGYRAILNAFLKKTSDSQREILGQLGLGEGFLSAATFKERGFQGVIDDLVKASGGDLDLIKDLMPNIRGLTGITKFLEGGFEEYEWVLEQVMDSEGTLDEAYEVVDGSIKRNWQKIRNSIDEYNRRFFDKAEFGGSLADALSNFADYLKNNEDEIMEKLDSIADAVVRFSKKSVEAVSKVWDERDKILDITKGLLMFYGVFKLFKTTGNALKWFSDISNVLKGFELGTIAKGFPLGKVLVVIGVILSIAHAIRYLYENWDILMEKYPAIEETIETFQDTWGKLSEFIDEHDVGGKVSEVFKFVVDVLKKRVEILTEVIMGAISLVINLVNAIQGARKVVEGFFTNQPELRLQGQDEFIKSIEGIKSDIKNIGDIFDIETVIPDLPQFFEEIEIDIGLTDQSRDTMKDAEGFFGIIDNILRFDITDNPLDLILSGLDLDISKESEDFQGEADEMKRKFNLFRGDAEKKVDSKPKISTFSRWMEQSKTLIDRSIELRRELEKPIITTPRIFTQSTPKVFQGTDMFDSNFPGNYKGTDSWKGGLTWVHERGAELMDLPGGTRIYPRDKSLEVAKQDGFNLAVAGGGGDSTTNYSFGDMYFTGDISSDVDINEIGTKITKRIIDELGNI